MSSTSTIQFFERTPEGTEHIVNDDILYPLEYYIYDCIDAGKYKMRIIVKGINIAYLYDYIVNANKNPDVYYLLKQFDMTIIFDLSTYNALTGKKSQFKIALNRKMIKKIVDFVKSDECKYVFNFLISKDVSEFLKEFN
jgi:hypothetical protein